MCVSFYNVNINIFLCFKTISYLSTLNTHNFYELSFIDQIPGMGLILVASNSLDCHYCVFLLFRASLALDHAF